MKRSLALALLFVGFLWIAWEGVPGLSEDRYLTWIWHSQHLPTGSTLSPDQVSNAMKDMSLSMNRLVLVPALMMLAGGLMLAYGTAGEGRAKSK